MGEGIELDTAYMIDKNGNKTKLGKITQIECTYATEWNKFYKEEGENYSGSVEITLNDKPISKKRFIKLLMGNYKIQRNEAIKMHNEFMKEHRERTEIGFAFFITAYFTNTLGNGIADFGEKVGEVVDKIIKLEE